jgi:hypothetical protein
MTAIASAAIVAIIVCIGLWALCKLLDRCADDTSFGWSASGTARRQAEQLQRRADKEFQRRQRLHPVRFWNF